MKVKGNLKSVTYAHAPVRILSKDSVLLSDWNVEAHSALQVEPHIPFDRGYNADPVPVQDLLASNKGLQKD